MNLIFILKGKLEWLPPVINQVIIAARNNYNVTIICSACNLETRRLLNFPNVRMYETNHTISDFKLINKFSDWVGFNLATTKILREINTEESLVIIGSVDTGICLYNILYKFKYVIDVWELYDNHKTYLYFIKKIMNRADAVVLPEYCRANIYKVWFKLSKLPYIIPNKPLIMERQRNMEITDKDIFSMLSGLRDKKIILYQGQIYKDRNLECIARGLKNLNNSNFIFLLVGTDHDDTVQQVKQIYESTYYVKYIPAPFHLQITSHAYIGVVSYNDDSLNNIFCAPNKIYEYGGFSVPMLARDIPGLKYTVGINNAGICVDIDDPASITNAIKVIDENYDFYSNNARTLYDETDCEIIFLNMLNDLGLKGEK